ncbi:MAG: aldo/keto reductase [Planctomycetota bacterium]|nr:aldo/keto reductase [Planctomycetota bacterium]
MEKRVLGRTGMNVSVLGFGGSEIGFQNASEETVRTLLNTALDLGLNAIDTAECYPGSEDLIGRAVAHRRNEFHLFTKVGHEHGLSAGEDWSADSITRTIDRSLTRLRTDRVDLVQLHSCGVDVLKRGEAIDALRRARDAGKTRFIGYSGDDAPARWAVESGHFDTLQTSLSIADQQAIDLTLPLARERNMGVIIKRPIANAAWRDRERPKGAYHETYWLRLQDLDYGFTRAAGEEAASTALRFTLSQPGVHTMIVGTQNPTRWAENARLVARGPLDAETLRAIRERWKSVAKPDWVGQV